MNVRCSPEAIPSWEPILAALPNTKNGPSEAELIGQADGGE